MHYSASCSLDASLERGDGLFFRRAGPHISCLRRLEAFRLSTQAPPLSLGRNVILVKSPRRARTIARQLSAIRYKKRLGPGREQGFRKVYETGSPIGVNSPKSSLGRTSKHESAISCYRVSDVGGGVGAAFDVVCACAAIVAKVSIW